MQKPIIDLDALLNVNDKYPETLHALTKQYTCICRSVKIAHGNGMELIVPSFSAHVWYRFRKLM